MHIYLLSQRPQRYSGDFEVHRISCDWVRRSEDWTWLGVHPDGISAVALAKTINPKADGCWYCCREADTG